MNLLRACALLAVAPLPLASGSCCGLARFFCGPDKSPWVQVDFATPDATLRTFLEALRRDRPDRVLECLAQSYREQHGLGIGGIQVAWERLQREVPYLYLAGYLQVPEHPSRVQDDGCSYELDLDGRTLRVDLVRQAYWDIYYRLDDGSVVRDGHILDHDSLNGYITVTSAGFSPDSVPQSLIDALPLRLEHPRWCVLQPDGTPRALPLDRIVYLAIGREWKIGNLVLPGAPQ